METRLEEERKNKKKLLLTRRSRGKDLLLSFMKIMKMISFIHFN